MKALLVALVLLLGLASPVIALEPFSGPERIATERLERPAQPAMQAEFSTFRTNWLDIPALGISSPIGVYGCSDPTYVNNLPAGVFDFVCNPIDHPWLVSHIWSTFAPLQQAYVAGALTTGIIAYHTDASGITTEYTLGSITVIDKTPLQSTDDLFYCGDCITMQVCLNNPSTHYIIAEWNK